MSRRRIQTPLLLAVVTAVGFVAVFGFKGWRVFSERAQSVRVDARPYSIEATTAPLETTATAEVLICEDAPGRDWDELVKADPGLRERLRSELETLVLRESDGYGGQHLVAHLTIVGAKRKPTDAEVYAALFEEAFSAAGGRVAEMGGGSMPVRVRLSSGSRPHVRALDIPGMGSDYGPSLNAMMPRWARAKAELHPSVVEEVQAAGAAWAEKRFPPGRLIRLPRPAHSDPHRHPEDVYSLRALAPAVHGFSVTPVGPLASADDTPGPSDLETASVSPDGRFVCSSVLRAWTGLVVSDTGTGSLVHVDSPGIGTGVIDRFAWRGHTLVFDIEDVGFSEPRPKEMTAAHVEVDLDRGVIERVVPVGPYSFNPPFL